jgi:hypothetical protein
MVEAGAQPVSALADTGLWFCRSSDADKNVPQRSWDTECGAMLHPNGDVLFGCRLQCVALGESPPFAATFPGVVRQIVETQDAYLDGRRVSLSPWYVDSVQEVDELLGLLLDSQRSRPVIAISLGGVDGSDGSGAIDPAMLAKRTLGAAHVVALTGEASLALSRQIGREFSVFHRAVRTYQPRLDLDDALSDHPLALPSTIESWGENGSADFLAFLVEQVLRGTVGGHNIYDELPSYADIRARVLRGKRENARDKGAPDTELLALAMEENESLQRKLLDEKKTLTGLLDEAEAERSQVEAQRDQLRSEVRALQARVMHIEAALSATGKTQEIRIPDSFDDLDAWCDEFLAGSVFVLPRARRMAKKSAFENPGLAYRTLLILRDWFVPMKRAGGLEKKQGYENALAELGLEESPSFSAERVGEQGDEYRVNHDGRVRFLERHIKGSSSRQERFGFRLYFFWDEGRQQAVVGAFPSHLNTRAT